MDDVPEEYGERGQGQADSDAESDEQEDANREQ